MSQAISLSPSMTRYFQEVVDEALRVRNVAVTEAASSYLVGLLCAFAHPDEHAESAFNQPLTFLLRDALEASGAERFQRLRNLGDSVLYVVGFFGGHIELKGVDRGYVVGVGSTAYHHAAAMLRLNARVGQGPDVLSEMAEKFERFVSVLNDVADGTLASGARDERSVLRLYERWVRTGSSRLADELGARGLVPSRGTGGLN
ncbi:hypothetical protein WME95_32675 [Sorangium sp. So ce327]|uniref:hypothetical protein n=2 Tax=Sorangium TaxID=39643 RepID=UPI003F604AE1